MSRKTISYSYIPVRPLRDSDPEGKDTKFPRGRCVYNRQWEHVEPLKHWVAESPKSKFHAHCKWCLCDISIKRGRQPLFRHMRTSVHKHYLQVYRGKGPPPDAPDDILAFADLDCDLDARAKEAELKICSFVLRYDLPADAIDNLSMLIGTCFADSPIAPTMNVDKIRRVLAVVRPTCTFF